MRPLAIAVWLVFALPLSAEVLSIADLPPDPGTQYIYRTTIDLEPWLLTSNDLATPAWLKLPASVPWERQAIRYNALQLIASGDDETRAILQRADGAPFDMSSMWAGVPSQSANFTFTVYATTSSGEQLQETFAFLAETDPLLWDRLNAIYFPDTWRSVVSVSWPKWAYRAQFGTPHSATFDHWTLNTPSTILGDLNSDGAFNNLDISPMVDALVETAHFFPETYPDVNPRRAGDANGDGALNNLDIAPFAALLTGTEVGTAAVPEPASLVLLVCGHLTLLLASNWRSK